nr:reverse transcriptase domain-containing protein [Tanacetum cinerariifolium]
MNYHQLLPIIAKKAHQEKVQQDKLKAVKAHLNFDEASQYSKSGAPSRKSNLKEMLRSRCARSISRSPEPRHGHSESPRKRGPERRTVFKRLENGVFHGLRDKGKGTSHTQLTQSIDHTTVTIETLKAATRVLTQEKRSLFMKNVITITSSRRTKLLSESEGSSRGNWKSKPKRQRSSVKDDMSQPWKDGESTKEFMRRYKLECRDVKGALECMKISGFMHGITNPELIKRLHDKKPKSVDKMMKVTTTFPKGKVAASNHERKKSFPSWKQKNVGHKHNFKKEDSGTNKGRNKNKTDSLSSKRHQKKSLLWRKEREEDGMEGPMIIEAEMGGHFVHRIYVDRGSSSEILYEHCFNRFCPEVRSQMIPATTPLVGFSREIIWPLWKISLLVKIGDEEHTMSAWMNFMIVRSPSPYKGIIGRPGVRRIQAISSTTHGMQKFPMAGETVTLQSSRIIPLECTMVLGPGMPRKTIDQVAEEKIQ